MNEDAPTPIFSQPGEEMPEPITLEHLRADPKTYRPQLLWLATMPWSRTVIFEQGRQPEQLVALSLDSDNLETIDASMQRVLDGEPIAEDTRKALAYVESATTTKTVGALREATKDEKMRRKRLLAVVDYLDELVLGKELRRPA